MFDSHCHLTDPQFAGDLDEVLRRAWDAGLEGITTVASNANDARAALELTGRDARIHATAGIHPHVAAEATEEDHRHIESIVAGGDVVAIGETGLDFHYDHSPRDLQRRSFERHLRMAADTGLPVIVHSRSADEMMAAMLRAATGVRGVLHCFAGGHELFDAAMDMDWYVSFAGLVTFRNFDNQALVRATPEHRLLAETDSPYLAPVPHRGRRNEPSYVVRTVEALAAIRGTDPIATGRTVTDNARAFYDLPPRS